MPQTCIKINSEFHFLIGSSRIFICGLESLEEQRVESQEFFLLSNTTARKSAPMLSISQIYIHWERENKEPYCISINV